MNKKISGINACDCDRRYKPVILRSDEKSPSTYYVKCTNCGKVGRGVLHSPYDSHIAAKLKAVELWNEENAS